MVDWTKAMQQYYEYYVVDPVTWNDSYKLDVVKSCSINRDSETETLGSATIDITGSIGECYVRVYLVTIQNGITERHPLATILAQSPSSNYDGTVKSVSTEAYTPLLELKETQPPMGYYIPKGESQTIMKYVGDLTKEHARAPVVSAKDDTCLKCDFVSSPEDSWLSFLTDLVTNAKHSYALDEYGRIMFAPIQDTASLRPVWTYTDDNSSILYPELTVNHDIYGIPNVVEVIASTGEKSFYAKVINDDPDSPVSTVNRGREIGYRVTDPEIIGTITDERIEDYARQLLKDLSTVEYTVSYTHGYCPVRIGDCVRLNYHRAGIDNVKAKVISQSIKCEPGCPVSEKAVFTKKLWG